MIFKVSFKETEETPSRIVKKQGRTATVYLKGEVALPEFWKHVPSEILEWIRTIKKLEVYQGTKPAIMVVYSKGVAKCAPDDKYDSLLGERLAEARAKYEIYKFFYDLTTRLYDYYSRIMFGDEGLVDAGHGSCLARDIKKYESLCNREKQHVEELLAGK